MSGKRIDHRYTHTVFRPGHHLHKQGVDQGEMALKFFHYLRASVLGLYDIDDDIDPDISRGQILPRQGIVFSRYTDFNLPPTTGIKLHPREDGTVNPEDLKLYSNSFRQNWKDSEAGILYIAGDRPREFYNIILNYHSPAHTTSIPEWDALFSRLKETDFRKNLIPCMVSTCSQVRRLCQTSQYIMQWFAREGGCLVPACPFAHDEASTRLERERILNARRDWLRSSLPQKWRRHQIRLTEEYAKSHGLGSDRDRWPDVAYEQVPPPSLYCAVKDCTVSWRIPSGKRIPDDDDLSAMQLKRCSKCKYTYYCSVSTRASLALDTPLTSVIISQKTCQTKDWPSHKSKCQLLETVVMDDDQWSPIGTREDWSKGVELF